MALHIIKLCVGVSEIGELADFHQKRLDRGEILFHTTRMMPRRQDEVLDGGSLYWVIKGSVQVRQKITDIVPIVSEDGIKRCRLMLHSDLIVTRPQPRRPFQGWRYLKADDAPADIGVYDRDNQDLPSNMRAELVELGLL
jgi:hypothetical protein